MEKGGSPFLRGVFLFFINGIKWTRKEWDEQEKLSVIPKMLLKIIFLAFQPEKSEIDKLLTYITLPFHSTAIQKVKPI